MNPVVDSSDKCLLLEQFLFQVVPVLTGRRVRESADFLLETLHELGVFFGSEKHFMVQFPPDWRQKCCRSIDCPATFQDLLQVRFHRYAGKVPPPDFGDDPIIQ